MAAAISSMCSVALTKRSGCSRRRVRDVFEKCLGVDGGVLADGFVLGGGVADDFILDVGDVHHVVELIAARAQPAAQNVLKGEGAQVADVDVIVDRRPAGVHSDHVSVKRSEGLHLLRKSVVETQGHRGISFYPSRRKKNVSRR